MNNASNTPAGFIDPANSLENPYQFSTKEMNTQLAKFANTCRQQFIDFCNADYGQVDEDLTEEQLDDLLS